MTVDGFRPNSPPLGQIRGQTLCHLSNRGAFLKASCLEEQENQKHRDQYRDCANDQDKIVSRAAFFRHQIVRCDRALDLLKMSQDVNECADNSNERDERENTYRQ